MLDFDGKGGYREFDSEEKGTCISCHTGRPKVSRGSRYLPEAFRPNWAYYSMWKKFWGALNDADPNEPSGLEEVFVAGEEKKMDKFITELDSGRLAGSVYKRLNRDKINVHRLSLMNASLGIKINHRNSERIQSIVLKGPKLKKHFEKFVRYTLSGFLLDLDPFLDKQDIENYVKHQKASNDLFLRTRLNELADVYLELAPPEIDIVKAREIAIKSAYLKYAAYINPEDSRIGQELLKKHDSKLSWKEEKWTKEFSNLAKKISPSGFSIPIELFKNILDERHGLIETFHTLFHQNIADGPGFIEYVFDGVDAEYILNGKFAEPVLSTIFGPDGALVRKVHSFPEFTGKLRAPAKTAEYPVNGNQAGQSQSIFSQGQLYDFSKDANYDIMMKKIMDVAQDLREKIYQNMISE